MSRFADGPMGLFDPLISERGRKKKKNLKEDKLIKIEN